MATSISVCIFISSLSIFALYANALPGKKSFPVPLTRPESSFYASQKPTRAGGIDLCKTNVSDHFRLGSGIKDEKYRWRNFHVQIDPAFSQEEYDTVYNGLYELSQYVCIPFGIFDEDMEPEGDYVFIQRGDSNSGCYSDFIGRRGGKQLINLEHNTNLGCIYHGTVMHECIHALGFFHEQARPDRDEYVEIHYENIVKTMEHNFKKEENTLTFSVPYDYNSIMHYTSTAFSKNGKETLTAKNGHSVGSTTDDLTTSDIQKLRRMYKCQ